MDTASTILAGTSQMTEAAQSLAKARTARTARKQAAMEAIGESAADMGKTFKEYGDWKEAKKAELDVQGVIDSERLGTTQGNTLVALNAYKPSTVAGYKTWAERRDANIKIDREKAKYDLDVAVGALEKRKADEVDESQKAAADAVKKYPVKDAATQEYLASGKADIDTIQQYYKDQATESREKVKADAAAALQAQKDAAAAARVASRNKTKTEEGDKNRALQEKLGERGLAIRERANQIAAFTADSQATARENAAKMDTWNAAFKGVALKNATLLKQNADVARAYHDELETHIQASKVLLNYYSSRQWTVESDDERQLLRERVKDTIQTLESESKTLEKVVGPGFQWEAPPPVPEMKQQGQLGQGAALAAPPDLTPDELKTYNSLDDVGKKTFMEALGK